MKVLITGGSGLVGTALTNKLKDNNIAITHLTRSKNSKAGVKTYEWDWTKNYLEQNALNDVTHIVHLAGEGIADKPWSTDRKRLIVQSRVLTARLLLTEVIKQKTPLQAFISASGIGFYGAVTNDHTYIETDERGNDFVAECCVQWENQADKFKEICNVVKFRTGIVLSNKGGALEKLSKSIKMGVGAPIGTGLQQMPWIHEADLAEMYYRAIINPEMTGVYNAVAPENVTNTQFTHALANALSKKIRFPKIPAWALKLIFSEMSEILLQGSAVSSAKIEQEGFQFKFPKIESALIDIYQS